MNYATHYRYDTFTAWRFTSLRSGQPAASRQGVISRAAKSVHCVPPN